MKFISYNVSIIVASASNVVRNKLYITRVYLYIKTLCILCEINMSRDEFSSSEFLNIFRLGMYAA